MILSPWDSGCIWLLSALGYPAVTHAHNETYLLGPRKLE